VYTLVIDTVRVGREIDRNSSVPPSRQVAAWLAEDIRAGVYAPGQRLPSIADLVGEYGIARDTALKAQRVLIADGLAVNSPGMGLFVADR
jgi:DNA-binding GntR family transcriptional regulator